MFHIVLVEPEIPQNTGNIARTCAATKNKLHLAGPLGFDLSDKHLKRAGMDYWRQLEWQTYGSLEEFYEKNAPVNIFYASAKGKRRYDSIRYPQNSFLVFGCESKGLGSSLLEANRNNTIRIPLSASARSLNLSNAAAIVLYEAMRQHNFGQLCAEGQAPIS